MPTRDVLASFWRDWDRLTPQQQRAFRQAVARFIADLAGGDEIQPGEAHITWRRVGTHSVFRRP
jgi:hypothetical protein